MYNIVFSRTCTREIRVFRTNYATRHTVFTYKLKGTAADCRPQSALLLLCARVCFFIYFFLFFITGDYYYFDLDDGGGGGGGLWCTPCHRRRQPNKKKKRTFFFLLRLKPSPSIIIAPKMSPQHCRTVIYWISPYIYKYTTPRRFVVFFFFLVFFWWLKRPSLQRQITRLCRSNVAF